MKTRLWKIIIAGTIALVATGCGGSDLNKPSNTSAGQGVGTLSSVPVNFSDVMIKLALGEVGNKYSSKYRLNASDAGGPWCARFVSWVLRNSSVPGYQTIAVADINNWSKSQGIQRPYGTYVPMAGDIVIWKNSTLSHVGLVVSATSATNFTIVAGNEVSSDWRLSVVKSRTVTSSSTQKPTGFVDISSWLNKAPSSGTANP